jgi:wyosine [tRNA(Phe)-imidazoG37] synthetase (radical SAM superfamily)
MGDQAGKILNERAHPRIFRTNDYVYPVLSRRAGGISVGINLSPNKACNFHCVYCQVDRTKQAPVDFVALPKLLDELKLILSGLVEGGWLWREPEFRSLDPQKAHVADIAFSGDGEPTTFKNFAEVVTRCTETKEQFGFKDQNVVLITNATGLDRPEVRRALEFLDSHRGEVWAKLDAGTPGYFALISGSKFPFQKILNGILNCARQRQIAIQSCFVRIRGEAPSHEQIGAYIARLKEMVRGGARFRLVQVYTAARDPAFSIVSSLSKEEVDAIAERVRRETGLAAAAFYGDVPEGRGVMGQEPQPM